MSSRSKHISAFAGLVVLAYLGNVFCFPIGFSVNFLFGSIFVIISLVYFGLGPGLLTSLIAASYTYQLWNHPYAIIIFTAEILWLGLALKRGRRNLVIVDLCYWLSLGLFLVWLFYFKIMQLGYQSTWIIFLKQAVNGTFNALIAGLTIHYLPLEKLLSRQPGGGKQQSLAGTIFDELAKTISRLE